MGPWYIDIHQASARGAALRELVRIRCTEPFDKFDFYAAADIYLRRRNVTYADLAAMLNQPNEGHVRMRIRDRRPPRAMVA